MWEQECIWNEIRESEIFVDSEQRLINLETRAEESPALIYLWGLDQRIQNYDIDLIIDRNERQSVFYFMVNWNRLSIELKNIDELEEYWWYLETLLNTDARLWLIWWTEWRAIIEAPIFGWDWGADRLVNFSQPYWTDKKILVANNNKIEELFAFVQIVKWNNESSQWYVDDDIRSSSWLWNCNYPQ